MSSPFVDYLDLPPPDGRTNTWTLVFRCMPDASYEFRNGAFAFHIGSRFNPHVKGSEGAHEWCAGWLAAYYRTWQRVPCEASRQVLLRYRDWAESGSAFRGQ